MKIDILLIPHVIKQNMHIFSPIVFGFTGIQRSTICRMGSFSFGVDKQQIAELNRDIQNG